MDTNTFKLLLDKYLVESITEEETRQLFRLLESPVCRAEMERTIDAFFADPEIIGSEDPQLRDKVQARLQEAILRQRPIPTIPKYERPALLIRARKWIAQL